MLLKFITADGKLHVIHLEGRTALTFGRSPEADVCIPDTKISRLHAEIRPWGGDYAIRDLDSRNGTLINGSRIEVAVLRPGDVLRIGGHEFTFEKESRKGTETIVREVAREAEEGRKGYRTMLREIVQSTTPPKRKT